MLHTFLTDKLGLRYPIVGAPMAGAGGGELARAITLAGGLGMIGINSETSIAFMQQQARLASGNDGARFGLGLLLWDIARRPEILQSAIELKPYVISLSAGEEPVLIRSVVEVHAAGILTSSQVNTVEAARRAETAGVDFIVAQGTEAGGHTGSVGTLPLLQGVLNAVTLPVLVAGGIASARGVAAALASGAEGVWLGTVFLASPEAINAPEARRRIIEARETDTILTNVFDRTLHLDWPPANPGRAIKNRHTDRWHGRVDEIDEEAEREYAEARAARNYDIALVYAGEAVGMVSEERPAGEIVRELGEGAEAFLRRRSVELLAD